MNVSGISDWVKIGVPMLIAIGGSWLAFEGRTSRLESGWELTEKRLDRIETKLDFLITRKHQ